MERRYTDITLQAITVGRDRLLIISGGERHIGASSTAYWEDGRVCVQTHVVPGHKEHILSEGYALRVAAELRQTVTLVMGIHYDQLQRDEIDRIHKHVTSLIDGYLLQTAQMQV
ncbi:hypothetical protein [Paenibacillus lentus]|uniref:Prenylated flavin chaperone LpdD-like domain-containing protein n=1 Tax=Paenibacillus lentus TaxID=1338368 RepID=A0A3S8RX00_9BACL|nr:hypothetical protein [Paenibacillus lentus]AZK47422.1 hypothetical protein EIM92_15710 [Paenibacillus lentus]